MQLYHGITLAILTLSMPVQAAQETRHKSLFQGVNCAQVQVMAEHIMLSRQYMSMSMAREHNNTTLDIMLINEAYDAPTLSDSERIIEAVRAFGERWLAICEASTT